MARRTRRSAFPASTVPWGWVLVVGGVLYVAGATRWPWVPPVGRGQGGS